MIILRSKGYTIPELKSKFKIGYGAVWRHIHTVKILPQYEYIWENKRKGSLKRKLTAEAEAKKNAIKLISHLSTKEKTLILSCLYWAEGNKKDFCLTNTDPNIIRLFIEGLIQILKVPKDKIRINIRIYEDINRQKSTAFWLKVTGLAKENLSSINILEGKKKGKLKYGMCRVRVLKGGNMLKYLQAINKQIIAISSSCSSMDRTEVS